MKEKIPTCDQTNAALKTERAPMYFTTWLTFRGHIPPTPFVMTALSPIGEKKLGPCDTKLTLGSYMESQSVRVNLFVHQAKLLNQPYRRFGTCHPYAPCALTMSLVINWAALSKDPAYCFHWPIYHRLDHLTKRQYDPGADFTPRSPSVHYRDMSLRITAM